MTSEITKPLRRLGHMLLHPRRRTRPGAPPGSIVSDPDAPSPVLRLTGYGPEGIEEATVAGVSDIREWLGRWPTLWVNVDGLGRAETIREIGELFGLHRLALEDVVNVHQRPKVEPYGENLFIVMRMLELDAASTRFRTEQVSLFLGQGFVVTFQERPGDCFDPVRDRLRSGLGRIRGAGADYLAYALLDAVIDHYFPAIEVFGEHLEALEQSVLDRPEVAVVHRIHAAKRDLLALRRAVWPQREALQTLVREPSELIQSDTRVYLRDCYDHAFQLLDLVETYREIGSGLMDLYLSSVNHRTNEIMKVLTIFAAIFIPLTFIAGVYGMNFDPDISPWNMPELEWRYGYPFSLALMAGVALGLLYFFRRNRWI